ncbi:uncharacterized protein J3R85_010645 [Psidium guajava]|nr:uncharacterized protein J3R85_010645 [Psidium guajava]
MPVFWVELGELVVEIVLLVPLVGFIQAVASNFTCMVYFRIDTRCTCVGTQTLRSHQAKLSMRH